MKRFLLAVLTIGILAWGMQTVILARGGGRGGGGGGRGGGGGGMRGGGGGMRGGGGFSPSASRPSRPSTAARPSTGARPSAGTRPSTGARPSAGGGQRAATRPAPGTKGGAGPGGANKGPIAGAGQRPTPGPGAGVANRPASRPSAGQLGNFLNIPAPATGAIGGAGNRRPGGAAGDFLQGGGRPATGAIAGGAAGNRARPDVGRPGTARDNFGRPGTARENFSQNRPSRIENRGERQGNRDQRRDEIRNQYHENNPGNFWEQYPGWTAWAITRPFAWATWGALGSWCGYGGAPVSFGYGEEIYYSGDQVYSGDQPIATTEEYADQAATLASSAPSEAQEKADWLPLGVFALTQDGPASGTQPSLYMQLAISKQGVISGTLKNTLTGKVQPLEGMVDKESQRVAWGVVDEQRPIIETGLGNLTQDTAPALIHFADGQTQQWLLVHIPEAKAF